MASLSNERIQEFKDILEKEKGKEVSWEEASDGAYRLAGLADLMFDCYIEDQRREKKLKENPKGFHLDGVGYTCFICGNSASKEQSWYDKWGIKCMTCQGAVDRKEIPASLAKDKESWYSKYDIESSFNIKGPVLRSWIKNGILKARTVTYNGKGVHVQLFLIKDNKDTLPPKKLVESHMVKETKDGKDWYHIEPWYKFVEPREHLKGYKIMQYLKVTYKEKEEVAKEIKKEPMKIKEIFKIGGIMQAIGGLTPFLDQNNCVVYNKTKTDNAVILHIKRESDGNEGNVYLRVKDEFKSIEDPLLNWAFASKSIMGLTLNQLEDLDTNLAIESSGGKMTLRQ